MESDIYKVPPGFEAESFDFAEETTPRQYYMIASTPRSGGTLLSQHLWNSGIMGAPAEYFGFYSTFLRLVARLQPDTIEGYMDRLIPKRTTANGVFGFKVHYDHLQFMLLSGMLARMKQMQVIAIERQDRLAQAVSHARALQTGQWNSLNTAQRAEPVYNAELIRWSLNHLGAQRQGWQTFFEQHKLTPLTVDYDQLAADPVGIAQQVIAQSNVPRSPVTPVSLPMVERQADATNVAWAERFRREEGAG